MKGRVKKGEVLSASQTELLALTDPQEARTAKMRAEYLRPEPKHAKEGEMVGPADRLRMSILSLSLFPNLYNKRFLDREMS